MKAQYSSLSIKTQLLVMLIIPITLIMLLVSLMWFFQVKKIITTNAQETLTAEKDYYVSIWASFIAERARILEAAASDIELHLDDPAQMYTIASAVDKRFHAQIFDVYAGLENGVYIDSSDWQPPSDFVPRQRPWYIAASAHQKTALTDVYLDSVRNIPMITMSTPLKRNGKMVGVLATNIKIDKLQALFMEHASSKRTAFIVDKAGHFLVHGRYSFNDSIDSINEPVYKAVLGSMTSEIGVLKRVKVGSKYYFSIPYYDETTSWIFCIMEPETTIFEQINRIRLWALVFGTLILAVCAGIIFFALSHLTAMFTVINRALKNIAKGDGDLTIRLQVHTAKEFNKMSRYFNETIEKVQISIGAVKENTDIMHHVGSSLANTIIDTSDAIHQINANINSVKQQSFIQSTSVSETAATMEEIVRTIRQLNSSIAAQTDSVAQSSAAVEEMVANIASITQTLGITDDTIKNLVTVTNEGKERIVTATQVSKKIAEESGSLLEASSVIQHIASQTNLLAMNAAIESAHAGEAGKGFAVVADEIRKLAEESSVQGKVITATLKSLSSELEMLSASSQVAEKKFTDIFHLAEQVKNMSNRLTESMREQENGSKEVLRAMKNISTVTMEVQAGSEEMLKGGDSIAEEMQRLDTLTRTITGSMNEMAASTVHIDQAIHEVTEISRKNTQSIERLVSEINKFKL
ncbi:MAG: methyl-accepting chemotaxis protein [Treponema sp.]|uniref:methyl-accepting chemotaxis protein n=1 Tax=Treponema sp. TaxID=166 RepID=UPI003FA32AA0